MVSFPGEAEYVNDSATPSVFCGTYFILVGSHRTQFLHSVIIIIIIIIIIIETGQGDNVTIL